MFGYVVANPGRLGPEENVRYRSCYCGLCKALGDRHGAASRLTVTYDMTFLVLALSSAHGEASAGGVERCAAHPVRPHAYWRNAITDYAADMNVALAYYDFLDDWHDDHSLPALAEARLFKKEYDRVASLYPELCAKIGARIGELSAIEASGETNPDIPANCFGSLMGELFAFRGDERAEGLRAFGRSLGRFIYIMDACMDLRQDLRRERYNPMITTDSAGFESILNLLMADCVEEYKRLRLVTDSGLIENILYSGVWTRFEARKNKSDRSGQR